MKFAVLSDTHYISQEMLLAGAGEQHVLRSRINRSVMRALAEQTELDTVLITGDLTDVGDELSHREFAGLLRGLQAAGKKVYVLTATHDFYFCRAYSVKYGWPVKYRMKPWERPWFDPRTCDFRRLVTDEFAHLSAEECTPPLVKSCTAQELWELYRPFGPQQAFSVCESAYSYCVKLEDKLWCLMLNNNFRDVDAVENMSPGYSPDCYRWIEGLAKQAKEEGAFLFACTHHPLAPPTPAYKIGGGYRNMRCSLSGHTLADLGITLVFSGHTHFADVAFCSSEAGNVLCNVTTPALAFLPPAWRTAEIDAAAHTLKLTAVPVEKTPEMNVSEPTLKEHFINEFIGEYRRKVSAMPHGLGKAVLGLQVRHLYPLCPRALSKEDYAQIKDMHMFDIIMEMVVNMQCGDGRFTPDTPVYRFMAAFAAAADSIAAAQPFINVSKLLQGYTVREVIEPLLFNNYVPDNNAEFVFDRLPEARFETPVYKSYAGEALMGVLSVLAALTLHAAPALAYAALPALTVMKKQKLKKNPPQPERY